MAANSQGYGSLPENMMSMTNGGARLVLTSQVSLFKEDERCIKTSARCLLVARGRGKYLARLRA